MTSSIHTLRMGMVGGGRDAFIGAIHRMAAQLDGEAKLVAGCLSSTPDKAIASGRDLGLDPARNYTTWQAMLEAEAALPPAQRIDFVSIVTPNHLHYEIARAFATAGVHVVCDKPLVQTSAHAQDLSEAVRAANIVLAVTYNYSGYPMVKQARALVRSGQLGEIRKVIVEYHQGWLASRLESTGHKQAAWRTDPARGGEGGAISDIGSHAEHLVAYVTGLEIESICADLTSFVEGRRVDDDAGILLRFAPPAGGGIPPRGVMMVSQVEVGSENDLRLSVSGTRASLHWRQENPNQLIVRPADGPEQVHRRGHACLDSSAREACRLPPGHPEGFIEAFANIYRRFFKSVRSNAGGPGAGAQFDFPDVLDGARGVRFIEAALESSRRGGGWISLRRA